MWLWFTELLAVDSYGETVCRLLLNSYVLVTLFTLFSFRSQHELEVSTKQAIFVGSSVSDTIKTCIAMGNERAALKVKSEFKVFR